MSSKEIPSSSPDQKTAGGEENSYFKHYIFVRLFAEHIKLEITFSLFQNGCWLLFTSIGASWLELGVFAELEIGSLKGEPSLTHCSEVVVKLQSPVSAANLEIRTQLQARCLKIISVAIRLHSSIRQNHLRSHTHSWTKILIFYS